jgi:hypothetical protein
MENRTASPITTQAKDMAVFCAQAVQGKARAQDDATGVLSVIANALLKPCCDGPADWRKSGD